MKSEKTGLNKSHKDDGTVYLKKLAAMLLLSWLIIIALSLLWNWQQTNKMAVQIAQEEARAVFDKDVVYRAWNASRGGVYAPVTPETQPNPFLTNIKERDIQTPSGRQLTLINPAYMIRQVHELGRERYGYRGHITSLNPIRPKNAPEPWEKQALESFEQGQEEFSELAELADGQYLRFMRPLITKKSCLKCHGQQGYREGDIRGGISVSVPMAPYRAHAREQFAIILLGHLLFCVLGTGGIFLGTNRLLKHNRYRRQVEMKIENTYRQLNNIMDASSQVSIIATDQQGVITLFNSGAEKMLGYSAEEMVGKQTPEIIHLESEVIARGKELTEEFDCPIEGFEVFAAKAKKEGSEQREWSCVRKDGSHLTVNLSVTAIYDKDGTLTGLLCVGLDITECKRIEQRQDELIAELEKSRDISLSMMEDTEAARKNVEEADRAKSQFLANMSHEIRTPMNAIIGFADILADEELTDEQRCCVNSICGSSKHLLGIINDILDFSKIEAGKLDVQTSECSLKQLFAKIESMMRPAALEKGLKFEIREDKGLPTNISTDPTRLEQCLINLINNAIKFTEEGHVCVKVSLEDKNNQPYIRFDVSDTGVGIPHEKQEKVFELFTQADGSTSRKYGGTGLGLTITRQLAELLGGELTLTSEEGGGSVFSLTIPAGVDVTKQPFLDRNNIADQMSDERDKLNEAKFSGHVLVVEDVRSNQMLVRLLLEKVGFEVTIAEDGNEAVQKALSQSFDLILMDIQMPNMNGYEATRKLRNEGVKTPIIALTASAMSGDEGRCICAGCDDYLSKPLDRRKLLEKIRKYLPVKNEALNEKANSVKSQVDELANLCCDRISQESSLKETIGIEDSKEILNWDELIGRLGDEELIKEVVPIFLNDSEERFNKLTEAVKAGDAKGIKLYAHALKGAATNVGAKRLSDIAYHLEYVGREKDMEAAAPLFDELKTELEKVVTFLSRTDWIEIAKREKVITDDKL